MTKGQLAEQQRHLTVNQAGSTLRRCKSCTAHIGVQKSKFKNQNDNAKLKNFDVGDNDLSFIWYFQLRPFEIRKNCVEEYKAISIQNYYWDFYNQCIKQHGLEK